MHSRSVFKCCSIGALFLRPFPYGRVLNTVADRLAPFQRFASSEGDAVGGRVSFANPLAIKIVHALQQGDRSKASNLLSNVSIGTHVLCADDFAYILGYCSRKPDPVFVLETWKILEERNVMSDKCYLHIIHSLCNAGCLEEAFALVKYIGDNLRSSFILTLYNCLLLACIRMQDIKHAYQCLDLMDSQMVGKNEVTYFALLKLAVWKKNHTAVHEIWKEYGRYYEMNIISLRKFIEAFAKLNDLQFAYKTMQHMVALALTGEASLFTTAGGKFSCLQQDIPIPLENGIGVSNNDYPVPSISINNVEMSNDTMVSPLCTLNDAERMKSESVGISMPEEHKRVPIMKILRWSFNDVIQACARSENSMLAEQLLLQMQNLGLEPSSHTFDGFLRAVISERGCSSGIEVLKLMQERNIKPYDSTLAILSVGCSKELDLDLAELLLGEISECPNVYPYNAFLAACDAADQPERAVRMLAKMKDRKIKPDIKTYELLFSLFVNVNAPYEEGNMLSQADAAMRIKAIEIHMLDNGVQHSQQSLNNLLKGLGDEGMIRELMQYLRIAEQQLVIQNTSLGIEIYNNVLHSLIEAKQSHMAIEIFKSMKICGFPPNSATYNIMIDCCSNIRCFKSASVLVSLMIRDGFWPQTLTYTALIKILLDHNDFDGALDLLNKAITDGNLCYPYILLDHNDFDGALDLLNKAITDGNQPDVLLFNTILSKACTQGRIDIIELIVEQMHQCRVQPDPSTCHYVFSAYVDGEFFSTALEALQVLSLRMISEDNIILQEKRAEFEEDFILAEDPKAELRIMKLLSSHTDKVCFAVLKLRWCVMLGSTLLWEPDQSPWVRRLSSAYCTRKEQASDDLKF